METSPTVTGRAAEAPVATSNFKYLPEREY